MDFNEISNVKSVNFFKNFFQIISKEGDHDAKQRKARKDP